MVPDSRTPLRAHRLRPLNQPRRVFVELSDRGLPVAVFEQRQAAAADVEIGQRRNVEAVGEVWRVDDEWWRQSICRRYVEVMLEGGKHTVLYEDRLTGEWFEQTP